MLLYSVAVITLVATSIATPPPGYIKQPVNDKSLPEYQYNYEVADDVGKNHGKVEARSGELASGRYYVNSAQSSTDVKYFADEWGYHPLVKYRSSNEHSTAGAPFAIGEEAVKILQNDDDSGQQARESQEGQQVRSVQIIQPYTFHKEADETLKSRKHDLSIFGDNRDVEPISLLESKISEESRNINYVNLPQRQTFEVISLNGIPSGDGSISSYSTKLPMIAHSTVTTTRKPPADVSYVSDAGDKKNDLLSAISEDQLYVENAGTFGERIRVSSSDSDEGGASYSSTTTFATPFDSDSVPRENESARNFTSARYSLKPYSATIKKNRKFQGIRLYNVGSSGHVNVTEKPSHGFNAFSSSTLSPTLPTTIDQYSSTSSLQDFSQAIETSQKTISSTTESTSIKESKIGLSNPQQINYALLSGGMDQSGNFRLSASRNENIAFEFTGNVETNRVTSIPKTTDGFSKPIVVAEVSPHKPFEYSTTFECEDNIVSSTPTTTYSSTLRPMASFDTVVTSRVENRGYESIASLILNPIQAGVSLVNAGEAHLISGNSDLNIAPVVEKLDQNVDFSVSGEKTQSQVVYEKVNSAFGGKADRVAEETREIVLPSPNQGIEIQKSVEIYHNAPVQEIHYPPQIFSQVIHIDQLRAGQRYIAENVQNAKQLLQRSGSPTTNTAYEINHDVSSIYQNLPEDKMQAHKVYMINQEYTDDEKAAQTNSILYSGAQRYYHIYPFAQENRDLKSFLESNNGRRYYDSAAVNTIHVGVESQPVDEPTASLQPYRSHDNEASYLTDINHGQQQIAAAVLHMDSQNLVHVQSDSKTFVDVQPSYQVELEKSPPIQQTFDIQVPVESVITQNKKQSDIKSSDIQPHRIEKIIEKTVRAPQPYPVEIEKIIEKKVPVPVEKVIEKKIPIPHLYPVHIQIPIDRIIEKRIPVPQPFPIPVEKIVEKKIPVPVQQIIPQPIPVPIKVEKIVEKKVPVPQPYPIEIERKIPIPVEITKYVEKPVPVQVPYGVQYGVSYQQIMKPQNQNLYSTHAATSLPLYGLSMIKNQQVYNLTQPFQGYVYPKPFIGFVEGKNNGNPYYGVKQGLNPAKKQFFSHFTFASQPTIMQSHSGYNPGYHRRHTLHRMPTKEKAEIDGYFSPVPLKHTSGLTHHNQGQQRGFQSKSSFHSTSATRSPAPVTTLRKVRQQDPYHQVSKGSFRQSKMEYGFKPPMIPSVQYDEETASKVES
ncbi:uncharacterized protein LOC117171246 [Belonocnema kinseyi]|uniref:uncharacterized protein LOC117171246 n=1 Tax=Belonocnema kinseyi TaxID=2817044 RepID=UPI00143D65F7|nr:uncharacterized protein LOC117171246 [Belonocnema kinseyi]